MTTEVRGTISVNARGFGFLKTTMEDGAVVSAFVAPPDLNTLLDGDVVSAELVAETNGRTSATKLHLVERTRGELFGQVVMRTRGPHLRVDRLVSNTDWPFEEGSAKDLAEGAFVVAELKGSVLVPRRVVAANADLGVERVIVRHGIRSTYSDALVAAAKQAAEKPELGHRRDLRDVPTVTIDAASTLDLDDALAVLPASEDGALRALISIADVDAFVKEGAAIDLEARLRGTSVYLAGRVLPMLPEVLSTQAISLNEGVDRPALTAELRIDAEGEVRAVDLYPSIIRSHARLTYDAVAAFFGGASGAVPPAVEPALRWLRTAAARLGAVRVARGGVSLAREEASVSLDPNTNEPLGVEPRVENEAHRLVERLMVAANEAVARWLDERGLPGLYRVHDQPRPDRVHQLAAFAHNFGIEAGFGPELSPRGLAAFEAQYKGTPLAPAMQSVLGRLLGAARYTVHPSPHFGLAAPLYLHFTSPIRRYADLVVHRVVKRYLAGDRSMKAGDEAMEALGERVNRVSAAAAKAETERHRMLVARLFASRVGEEVPGHIVNVQPFGLVVQIEGTGATGTVALDALPDGPYRIDLAAQEVVGPKRSYAVGESFPAKIAATNEDLGRVELVAQ